MKKVVEVSIARFPFTLEENANILLENYITDLKEYYIPSGEKEVVDGIEERIAELLLERCGKGNVVTLQLVEEIIEILGRPEDMETTSATEGKHKSIPKKRLFRDPQNKVISGVCSGISAYIGMDVVYVRLLAVVVLFVLGALVQVLSEGDFPGVLFDVILYFLLVIIIPKAVTVEQRCQMRGEAENVRQIRKNVMDKEYMQRNSSSAFYDVVKGLARIMAVFIGVVLIITGVCGLASGLFLLLGIELFQSVSVWEMLDLLQLNINCPLLLKIVALLVYFIPCIGMLYGGVMLCFKVKSPKWKPGIILFTIWICAAVLFLSISIYAFRPYFHSNCFNDEISLPKQYDTLYINRPNTADMQNSTQEYYFKAGRHSLTTYYKNTSNGENEYVVYPYIRVCNSIEKQGLNNTIKVRFRNFSRNKDIFSITNTHSKASDVVTVKDSLITLTPLEISKENKFDGRMWNIDLYVPVKTVVVLTQPKEYVFPRDARISRK